MEQFSCELSKRCKTIIDGFCIKCNKTTREKELEMKVEKYKTFVDFCLITHLGLEKTVAYKELTQQPKEG